MANITTLADLESEFLAWMAQEVGAGRSRPDTKDYYRRALCKFTQAPDPDTPGSTMGARPLAELIPYHLERHKSGWHSVQSVQRLFNWGLKMGLVPTNPFAGVERPLAGERERTLSRTELARMLRHAQAPFRRFLLAMRHTLARPQEIRALCWGQLLPDGTAFELREFKGKRRRRDGVRVRWICVDQRLRRLLERMRVRQPSAPGDHVWLNSRGKPWSASAIRTQMRRLRARAGLEPGEEPVVCYTLRHTAATNATANGVRDKLLAELLGHSSTRTTQRYQHLQCGHLAAVIEQATSRRAS